MTFQGSVKHKSAIQNSHGSKLPKKKSWASARPCGRGKIMPTGEYILFIFSLSIELLSGWISSECLLQEITFLGCDFLSLREKLTSRSSVVECLDLKLDS